MRAKLLKDIAIPAGTIFEDAPMRTRRFGKYHTEHILGLSKDTSGEVTYHVDPDDPMIREWFEVL